MENKVFMHGKIVVIQVVGDQTEESVQTMGKEAEKIIDQLRQEKKQVLLLDDIRKVGKVTSRGGSAVVSLGKKLKYDKLAFLGNPGILRLGANLMFQAIGKGGRLSYFEDEVKAIKWLEKPRSQFKLKIPTRKS